MFDAASKANRDHELVKRALLLPRFFMASTSKKRKFEGNASKRPTKQPRRTIDSFFSPQVLAPASSSNDNDRKMVSLNAEQNAILRQVVDEGKNVFFTGSAGTGKSLLLRAIINALKRKYKTPDAVAVTASTGMAASNIGGMTIHAWGAVAPTPTEFEFQISCIKKCRPALQRWRQTKVLIIDEVSMVDGPLFTRICKIAENLRKNDHPFGGIQLIVTGDFFQLPPVAKNATPVFAFECDEWKRCIEHTLTLTHVFRQKDDEFVDLLNQLRLGTITPAASATFKALSRPLPPDPAGILPTELFPLRQEVDRANSARLAALTTAEHSFHSRDSGTAPDDKRAKLLENMMAPQKLVLKVGAQVMLIKNLDERLVNGSVGKVIGFWRQGDIQAGPGILTKSGNGPIRNVRLQPDGKTPEPRISKNDNKENAPVSAGPSGKVKAEADKGKGKEKAKVAVSRDEEQYPLVEFPALDGSDSEAVLLVRDEFRVEDSQGTVLARRMQVPLILAWSISIHKSQGQTIHRVKIDLGKVFEKGQSYVALSRAASMGGLQVLRFEASKVQAHPKVLKWNSTLQNHQPPPVNLASSSGSGSVAQQTSKEG
ncbi:ATP-dependent DNA helicase PIF1 [Mycena venus]|uniref:ATP-dependent DNA helicase PIF1 n=1 Tax=Mycena venus TaxID=2733690 RepID=A0A8H6WYH6_9AGAR|nr:ATP-dependent DNA helicase PIF1 [Mycena venus]